jgi:hypothetical protein
VLAGDSASAEGGGLYNGGIALLAGATIRGDQAVDGELLYSFNRIDTASHGSQFITP